MVSDIITTIMSVITPIFTGLFSGIKDGINLLLWVDPEAETRVLSTFAQLTFVFVGMALALGLGYKIIGMIKNR